MTGFTMTINGAATTGDGTFDVIDPATGEVFAQAPDSGRGHLDAAMNAAAEAYRHWKLDEEVRRRALLDAADALDSGAERLARLLTSEQGRPLPEARAEIGWATMWLRYYADLEIPREIVQDDQNGFAEVARRPMGVVAAIAPWNLPIILAIWKIAPALLAGNTMVLKPSPFTPLATLAMGEMVRGVFPPGVLNIVSGQDPLGAWMTAHPTPRKITFTGSVATGMKVAAAAAKDLKRVTLELGGNDPAIVLEDADLARIADDVFTGAFMNNGQNCMVIKRVYVHERRHADLVEALAERAKAARVGSGFDDVQLGPIANRPQFDRVSELVTDAIAHGAVAAAGGRALERPGYFFEPTILTGVSDGIRIVDEEQFGPALPVIAYRDLDDVVDRANDTPYGLTASVWTDDDARAADVASRLECGQVTVNAHGNGLRPDLPFGGHKQSGIGVTNGPWGLHRYTELQALTRPARTTSALDNERQTV
ncbi:aldehyde dehydrogenase family protein [Actinomadura rudentiformis]|uniref:Aldehyde dehydrogenase family protein n=1 Tax=Actinomadura rudentiformis TaxID=359158 RepID=A0A6H9YBJ6_9ACTN|nr:aldehyde dehydrogenase family protein [Actinomadura rudentiformis]KAB2340593.1 aldehyde dehydrogenase family protein [Actinomadura rudentiformis]